jgi:hypothetical protein
MLVIVLFAQMWRELWRAARLRADERGHLVCPSIDGIERQVV